MSEKKAAIVLKIVILVSVVALFVYAVSPVIITSIYTVPSRDDFTFAINNRIQSGWDPIVRSIQVSIDFYNQIGGLYAGHFNMALWCYLCLEFPKIVPCYMVFSIAFMISAILVCCKKITDSIGIAGKELKLPSIVFAFMFVVTLLGWHNYKDVWTWVCGNANYCLGMAFSLYFLFFYYAYTISQKKIHLVVSILFSVFAGGLSTAFVGWVGFVSAVIYLKDAKKNKCFISKRVIPFICIVIFSIITIVSPGNFIRQTYFSAYKLPVIDAIYQYIKALFLHGLVGEFLSNPYLPILAIVSFFIGTLGKKKTYKTADYVLMCFSLLCVPAVCLLPFVVGTYGVSMPDRVQFVYFFTIYVFWAGISMVIGTLVKQCSRNNKRTAVNGLTYVGLLLTVVCLFGKIQGSVSTKMWNELRIGSCQNYSNEMRMILDDIKESNTDDYVITVMPQCPNVMRPLEFTTDVNNSDNKSASFYYKKNSIRVKSE